MRVAGGELARSLAAGADESATYRLGLELLSVTSLSRTLDVRGSNHVVSLEEPLGLLAIRVETDDRIAVSLGPVGWTRERPSKRQSAQSMWRRTV